MIGESKLIAVATGTSTPWPTSSGQGALLSIGLSAGTASAAATFTVATNGTSGTASLLLQSPANQSVERKFVSGVQCQQIQASVASNAGACNVEVL